MRGFDDQRSPSWKKTLLAKALVFWTGVLGLAFSDLRAGEFGLRIMAGWVHSRVNYERVPGIDRLGLGLGIEAWWHRNFGFEADLIYIPKGYYVEYEMRDHDFVEVSFPLLLKARVFLDSASSLALSVFGGAEYSRILTEMDPNYGQHDFGIVAGGTVEKRLDRFSLFLEGRYHWGLLEQSDEYLPSRFEFKTRTLFLAAGIKVRF